MTADSRCPGLELLSRYQDPGFLYEARRPQIGLARWIESYAVVVARRCRTAVERALPDWSVELHFNLGSFGRFLTSGDQVDPPGPRSAWVVGQRAQSILVAKETRDCDHVIVRLRPCAAGLLLGVPASHLRGALVDLDQFWGPEVERIRERLAEAASPVARVALLEHELAARIRRLGDPTASWRLCAAGMASSHLPISHLANRLGVTHRAIIRAFDDHAGLKPKVFARVGRLRNLLEAASSPTRPRWTELAHRLGYFDQAHLIHDFQRLTQLTPTAYERTRSIVGQGFVPHRLATQDR